MEAYSPAECRLQVLRLEVLRLVEVLRLEVLQKPFGFEGAQMHTSDLTVGLLFTDSVKELRCTLQTQGSRAYLSRD